jgi:hypothetical protein
MNSSPNATWRRNKLHALLLAAGLVAGSACVWAEDEISASSSPLADANVSGSLRASFWGISNNAPGNSDIGIAETWLKAAPHLGDASLVMEGWARDTDVAHAGKTNGVLREGYLSLSAGDADFRIGKQIIVWGRADQLNPTDNLTPRNNTLYMADTDDQRLGALAVKSTYNFSSVALTGIWLPGFQPNKQPLPVTPGVVFAESVPSGDQFALKLEQSGQTVDWSMSYFRGFDLNPDIRVATVVPGTTTLMLQHHRIRVLGADAATVVGRYGLRAEMAYTQTEDAAGTDPFVKNPFFYGVAGADRTFYEYLNVNLQYFVRKVTNYSDPNAISNPMARNVALQQAAASSQLDRIQQGASLRIGDKWLNETLEAEVAAVVTFTRGDFLLRPKVAYAFDDRWKGSLGAYVYRGGSNTLFGLMRNRSAVFTELRYSF